MDKNAIKKYAVWARRELIARVSQKAEQYGITEKEIIDERAESIHGVVLTPAQKSQRQALIRLIRRDGYQQAMEEVAYTWFNRFIALRFMEVNDYLPGHTRAFTDEQNAFKPKILADALNLELTGLDLDKIIELKETNKTEELYQYLLITLCNHLNAILPGMFQRIDDYTELLFPEHLLREGSVLDQLVAMIPQEDWLDAVQIIGWLYQYYNAEPKDQVFANLKKNIKISKKDIPAATQLFTPDWIVRYMVENSLGRLWVEGHPDDNLKAGWKYYIEEAEQEPDVQAQLQVIRSEYAKMKPEDILCIDPCSGSGHILVYLFDVLVQIYEAYGYPTRDAVASIVQNNLWGLDIDDRAAQLAYFAVMMKARQYDKGWFRRGIDPHVFVLKDSGDWSIFQRQMRQAFVNHPSLSVSEEEATQVAKSLFDTFADAKEYGSIIQPDITLENLAMLEKVLDEMKQQADLMDFVAQADAAGLIGMLKPMMMQCRALVQKYHVVVTNPPYMGASGMGDKLIKFVKERYPDSKNDFFAVFIERIQTMLALFGYQSMITQHAWMFLSSFEKLRVKLQAFDTVNMVHLGARAFEEIGGEVVQTTSFVLRNNHMTGYKGTYCRLIKPTTQQGKEDMFLSGNNRYIRNQDNFFKIPGCPIAYWISAATVDCFALKSIKDVFRVGHGVLTGHDEGYIFFWHEMNAKDISFASKTHDEMLSGGYKYCPMTKGGEFRKWYGNLWLVLRYDNRGIEGMSKYPKYTPQNSEMYFKEGMTWTEITSGSLGARYLPAGCIFNHKGPSGFGKTHEDNMRLLGYMVSVVSNYFGQIINPTITCSAGVVSRFPVLEEYKWPIKLVEESIQLSRDDWDSFETSWDFKVHPLIRWSRGLKDATSISATMDNYYSYKPEVHCSVELCYMLWQGECNDRFNKLKANEEELNRIFIDIYGLQDELTPEVADKDVTVRKADLGRDIRSLVSYAVGCMLGRYSLDKEGLAFAGGEWDASQYHRYPADKDGILPITDDDYFADDIVSMFVDWVRTVFGADDLEENLKYIGSALYPNGSGTAREQIRQYFLNDFYKDHLKIYQKRPIYWLFDAGKKNSFKCLIYLHRYRPDTIARVRTDYVHEIQARYRTAMEDLAHRAETAKGSERVRLQKQLTKIQGQDEELRKYEEKIHHYADMMLPLDLDDGVKVNYAKLQDVLAPIK